MTKYCAKCHRTRDVKADHVRTPTNPNVPVWRCLECDRTWPR
jgi:hypothetical protein